LKEVWQTFRQKAEIKQLAFNYSKENNIKSFSADGTRLRQILFNLIGNALKFTDSGKVWIYLKKDRNHLLFEVGDTGPGIPKKRAGGIFEEFSQPSDTSLNNKAGTGLGLAISKKLVKAMGGKIGVKSNVKKGSTFWFQIPYTECTSMANATKRNNGMSGIRILVVDDDPLVGKLMQKFLNKQTDIITCNSPIEALKIVNRSSFDLIITDLKMPEMNGIEFTKHIRANYDVPILVLSAGVTDENIQTLNQFSNVFRMPKPFSRDGLTKKIHTLLGDIKIQAPSHTDGKPDSSPLFDLSGVLAFTGDDQAFFHSVASAFVEDTDKNIDLLSMFIKNRETGKISDQAHKMLTGFRQFGIAQGITILKGIEVMGRKPGFHTELKRGLKRLKKLWQEVKPALIKVTKNKKI
jgi:CheY-like chemotaxis protein